MRWTVEKLANRIESLEQFRYREARAIHSFRVYEDAAGEVGARPPEWDGEDNGAAEIACVGKGYTWAGRDQG